MPKYPPCDRKRRVPRFVPAAGKHQARRRALHRRHDRVFPTDPEPSQREYENPDRQPGTGKPQKKRRDEGKYRQNPWKQR